MTNEEAINILDGEHSDIAQALSIGRKAIAKQIPKKPEWFSFDSWNEYICPSCNNSRVNGCRYCPRCGQAIDWSEEND